MSDAVADPLLAELRAAALRGPAAASEALGELLLEEAAPLLWRVLRAQLSGVPTADQEEVHAAALLRLTERLQAWLAGSSEVEITNFRAYVATTGANGCRAWLRARHPERTRLQNQLRYLLRHDPRLALWESDSGLLCGLAAWQDREASPPAETPPARRVELALGASAPSIPLPELALRIFLAWGRPCSFRDFQQRVADLLGIEDREALSLSSEGNRGGDSDGHEGALGIDPPETRAAVDRELEGRQFLLALWAEVRLLPLGQRRALLLNLRDDQGRDRLALLTHTGVATRRELARLLEIAESELELLWDDLPLEDRRIGERFDLTPRQVINLRKSARARLGRRLRPEG